MSGHQWLTTGQVATHLGVQLWQVDRLYLRGLLPEPERFGRFRLVNSADLPAVRAALVKAGYLKPTTEEGTS